MDLGDILRVIGKRWYIMLPVVLVTVALTVAAYLKIPMTYQSTSQISLLSPQQQASGAFKGQSNPFLIFDTSLTSTADLLARNLTSHDSAEELKAKGVTEEYTAKLADFAQGPFISLTVTGTDKAHVLASTITLTAFARDRLREIQQKAGVPADNLIQTTVVIAPQPPEQLLKGKLQIVLAVLAGGLVLSFMATFITEGLYRSRNRNRRSATVSAARRVLSPGASPPVSLSRPTPSSDSEDTAIIVLPVGGRPPAVAAANGSSNGRTSTHPEPATAADTSDNREPSPSVPIPRGVPADDVVPANANANGGSRERQPDGRWLPDPLPESPTEPIRTGEAMRTGRRTQPAANGNGTSAQSSALYRSAYAARDGAGADGE